MMEFAALDHALEHAEAEAGQVMALVGQAGVGKSRRLYECVHLHRTPPAS